MTRRDPLHDIMLERARQDEKWGANRSLPAYIWLSILTEELGEVAEAVLKSGFPASDELRSEVVQVCAVGLAWLEAMERQTEALEGPGR